MHAPSAPITVGDITARVQPRGRRWSRDRDIRKEISCPGRIRPTGGWRCSGEAPTTTRLTACLSDDDFKLAALTFDDNIRRHISFLNGVVHQAAAGQVHTQLWNLILDSRSDDTSVYAVYRDFLVDA